MTQQVVSAHFPYLPLMLTFGGHQDRVDALLDTGFDGDVILPTSMIPPGVSPLRRIPWTLADGSVVWGECYRATAQIGTFPSFDVVVSVVGSEPLVGRSVSDRFRVTLDHGQQVIIEL